MDATSDNFSYHTPVLFNEAIEGLNIQPGGIYVDATFGGGGHSRGIIEKLSDSGKLYGFDQDLDAMKNALRDERFTFVRSPYQYIPNFMRFYGVDKVDGILADLGVSSHHFDEVERGFTLREDAPLDMRMNQASLLTAEEIVNEYDEENLRRLFIDGSDIDNTSKVVHAVLKARNIKRIKTTNDLINIVAPLYSPQTVKKRLAQIFQAIRIAVNHELSALDEFLINSSKILKPGGRLAVITYHSLEDRPVKNFMKSGNLDGEIHKDFYGNTSSNWKIITRKPITPSAEEIERNPRSRSAKLRIAELISSS